MRVKTGYLCLALIFIMVSALPACSLRGKELAASEQQTILTHSDPLLDDLLAGLHANDYAQFSRHFDDYVQKTFPADEFASFQQTLQSELGGYLSRTVDQVTRSDEFYMVAYRAVFEKEDQVSLRIALHAADMDLIGGLWFESPSLPRE